MKLDKNSTAECSLIVLWAVVAIAAVAGWIMKIIALASETDTISFTEAAIRITGVIVAPFGAVMGYF